MTVKPARRLRPLARPLAIVSILAAGTLVSVGVLSSCQEDYRGPRPRPTPPARGAPIMRVRLTVRAVESVRTGATGAYTLSAAGESLPGPQRREGSIVITRRRGLWRIGAEPARGGQLVLTPKPDSYALLGRELYRGTLRLVPAGENAFRVINHVDMESYLAGVLPRELFADWHLETYRALAVAGRTFALYNKRASERRGHDVNADQSSQVYGGIRAETGKSWEAVDSTRGQVLTYSGKMFMAQYSSTCGGRVNPARVLREAADIPPLEGGQRCTDCRRSPKFRWPPVQVDKADAYRALAAAYPSIGKLGGLRGVRVVEQTSWGRPVWIDVVGPTGRAGRIRAEDLRLALLRADVPGAEGLYSMNCRIVDRRGELIFAEGRGFGHGVGLCQYGAEGKARDGATAEQILDFYYPGSDISRAYR